MLALLSGTRQAAGQDEARLPSVAVVPVEIAAGRATAADRVRLESWARIFQAGLDSALQRDTTIHWLPAMPDRRPRGPDGLPMFVDYAVLGTLTPAGADSIRVLWRLVTIETSTRTGEGLVTSSGTEADLRHAGQSVDRIRVHAACDRDGRTARQTARMVDPDI